MSKIPENLKYTKDHEWVLMEEGIAKVGITDHAQEALGDITFVELPAVGDSFNKGDTFGVVESVKAASDLYIPISGTITEINEELESTPETINGDPYESGWIIKVEVQNAAEAEELLDPAAYQVYCENES